MQNDIKFLVENKEILGGKKNQDFPGRWLIPIANLPDDMKYLGEPGNHSILLFQNFDGSWEIW
jgi:hypothetical protein